MLFMAAMYLGRPVQQSIPKNRDAHMTQPPNKIKLFEEKQVRAEWDEQNEKWWFSIADICAVLAESVDGRKYWSVLKTRLKKEGSELATNCSQLKID